MDYYTSKKLDDLLQHGHGRRNQVLHIPIIHIPTWLPWRDSSLLTVVDEVSMTVYPINYKTTWFPSGFKYICQSQTGIDHGTLNIPGHHLNIGHQEARFREPNYTILLYLSWLFPSEMFGLSRLRYILLKT